MACSSPIRIRGKRRGLLGFVNFRLYHKLNLRYPPQIKAAEKGDLDEILEALNRPLERTSNVIEEDNDEDAVDEFAENEEALKASKAEMESMMRLKTLFDGKRFFLSREIPRQPLVFAIRSFGGSVQWDDEDDESVHVQISDRSDVDKKHVNRLYVQPQWVFDSINRKETLPAHKYTIGANLPPHLSPFEDDASRRVGDYAPPEEKDLFGKDEEKADDSAEEEKNNDEEESAEEEEEENDSSEEQVDDESAVTKMKVVKSVPVNDVVDLSKEELRLRQMMIPKKHRGLYKSMMKSRKRRVHESKQLEWKRKKLQEKRKQHKNDSD